MIDLESGHVILAEATINVEIDVTFEGRASKISGTLAVRFERKKPEKATESLRIGISVTAVTCQRTDEKHFRN